MTRLKNFMKDGPTPSIIDTEYGDCNFSQPAPVDIGDGVFQGIRIFPGDDTPRTFIHCNLVKCEAPPGSIVTRCNTTIVERNIDLITDTIVVDGESFDVVTKINRVHGRWTSSGYAHKPSPEDIIQ